MVSRALGTLAVALLFVIAVEVGLHQVDDRLDEPLDWYHGHAQALVDDMERLADAGITSDLVFVGTSMTRAAVQIPIIETELATVERAHNAALPAAQTPVVRTWLIDEVVPRIHPRRVVWGISSLDFNGNRPDPTIDRYLASRAVEPGWVAAIDRALGEISLLSHHRDTLRDPRFLVELWEPNDPRPLVPIEDVMSPRNTSNATNIGPEVEARISEEVLTDFVVGARELADFEQAVAWLTDRGVETVIVLLPVPGRYLAAHPGGPDDFAGFRSEIIAATDRLGVPLLDYSATIPDSAFRDFTHLGPAGAEEFSILLSADLRARGW